MFCKDPGAFIRRNSVIHRLKVMRKTLSAHVVFLEENLSYTMCHFPLFGGDCNITR